MLFYLHFQDLYREGFLFNNIFAGDGQNNMNICRARYSYYFVHLSINHEIFLKYLRTLCKNIVNYKFADNLVDYIWG